MSERRQKVIDEGALHKYRTEIPNTIIRGMLGRGLSLPARWLYVYLKSIAGDCGECWQNMTTLTTGSQLGRGSVSNARKELVKAKLIVVIKGKGALHETDRIRILDIWDQNMAEFRTTPSSPDERAPSSPDEREDTQENVITEPQQENRVHQMNWASSPDERASSPDERLLKKISLKKEIQTSTSLPVEEGVSNGIVKEQAKPKKAQKQPNTFFTPAFERAWDAVPAGRKVGKVEAFTTWNQRKLEPRTEEIIEKLERLKATLWKDKELKYIPLGRTWFSEARYEDELVPLDALETALPENTPYM